jgi:hypothetical protein
MNGAPQDDSTTNAVWLAGMAIQQWEDERNKIHALAVCLVSALAPKDPTDSDDDDRLIEWRLAQVIEEMLGCTASVSETRNILMGVTK